MIDGRNYIRNTILGLKKLGKPFILSGNYFASENLDYVTYRNIRPYVPEGAKTNQICDHINVRPADVEKYIAIRPDITCRRDYLVCRAMEYRGKDGQVRGGIVLTEELGIPPVMRKDYPPSEKILASVPKHLYVDFFTFAEGRYAYYGQNLWVNGHKIKPSPEPEEETKPKKHKKEKQSQLKEISIDNFMDMYYKANPLWIPPPADTRYMDATEFLQRMIPQRNLLRMLDGRPSLRKQVLEEFYKRM